MNEYITIPILTATAKCGIEINGNTDKMEVAVCCPFCGDHKRHLYLNIVKNQFFCHRCGEFGNSISLYAKVAGCTNRVAYHELTGGVTEYNQGYCNKAENELRPLMERHVVYDTLLNMLALSEKHKNNLLERGLDDSAIGSNKYRTAPSILLANSIAEFLSKHHDLTHIPGFYSDGVQWRMAPSEGMYVPIRTETGHIQGLQIRLDNAKDGNKYKWFSSRFRENGAGARAWIHTVNWGNGKTVYITEGALKADVAANISAIVISL